MRRTADSDSDYAPLVSRGELERRVGAHTDPHHTILGRVNAVFTRPVCFALGLLLFYALTPSSPSLPTMHMCQTADDPYPHAPGYRPVFLLLMGVEGTGHHLWHSLLRKLPFRTDHVPSGVAVRDMPDGLQHKVSDLAMTLWAFDTKMSHTSSLWMAKEETPEEFFRLHAELRHILDDHVRCKGPTSNSTLLSHTLPEVRHRLRCPSGEVPGSVSMLNKNIKWQQSYPYGHPRIGAALRRPNAMDLFVLVREWFDIRALVSRRDFREVILSTTGSRFKDFAFIQQVQIVQDNAIFINSEVAILDPANVALIDYNQVQRDWRPFVEPLAAFLNVRRLSLHQALLHADPSGRNHTYDVTLTLNQENYINDQLGGLQALRWPLLNSDIYSVLSWEERKSTDRSRCWSQEL